MCLCLCERADFWTNLVMTKLVMPNCQAHESDNLVRINLVNQINIFENPKRFFENEFVNFHFLSRP